MHPATFDPSDIARPNGRFFGFPYTVDTAKVVFLPVPWDVTTSYGAGTAQGPAAMMDASLQLDFYDRDLPQAWQLGHGTDPINQEILAQSAALRPLAQSVITHLNAGGAATDPDIQSALQTINQASADLNRWVYQRSQSLLDQGKLVAVVGGDHSVPLGLMRAIADRHESFGILQIDAHGDLRSGYEGFTYSHAAIMFHALKLPSLSCLVQVGIRDICEAEMELAEGEDRVVQFQDWGLKDRAFEGVSWASQCQDIIAALPELVYISFDIDGLNPLFCPHTGTPVPGGLDFNEALFLIQTLVGSGRRILGFDLCEVAPGGDREWDANVGARLLYKLANLMYRSQMG